MATAAKSTAKPTGPVPAITVVCATPGFRRGGRAWYPEATTVATSEFDKDQLAAIRAEPRLAVVDTEINPPDAADTSDANKGNQPT